MNQLWHNGRVKCGWGVEGGEGTGGELGQPHSLARAAVAGHRQRSAGRPHAGARAVVIVASGAIAALQVFYFFFGWKERRLSVLWSYLHSCCAAGTSLYVFLGGALVNAS